MTHRPFIPPNLPLGEINLNSQFSILNSFSYLWRLNAQKQKHNAEIAHKAQPKGRVEQRETDTTHQRTRLGFVRRFQGLRRARKRSLLGVNEHFEPEHNAEIAHKAQPKGGVK